MKTFLLSLFAVAMGVLMVVPEVEAKRFGGGRSFGMQRDSTGLTKPVAPPTARDATGASPARNATGTPPKRSWMGPLAGLAAGLGIAALLSHFGLGEEFASMIMLALLVFGAILVVRMVLTRFAAGSRQVSYAGPASPALRRESVGHDISAGAEAAGRAQPSPADSLDVAAFERQAKLNFIRLQAASDRGDLEDIRAFTTPEVFAEIAMQLRERGDSESQTDVMELAAEVLDVSELDQRYVVSVRFTGTLREQPEAAPLTISETWHLVKPKLGSEGWRVAGIQQD